MNSNKLYWFYLLLSFTLHACYFTTLKDVISFVDCANISSYRYECNLFIIFFFAVAFFSFTLGIYIILFSILHSTLDIVLLLYVYFICYQNAILLIFICKVKYKLKDYTSVCIFNSIYICSYMHTTIRHE